MIDNIIPLCRHNGIWSIIWYAICGQVFFSAEMAWSPRKWVKPLCDLGFRVPGSWQDLGNFSLNFLKRSKTGLSRAWKGNISTIRYSRNNWYIFLILIGYGSKDRVVGILAHVCYIYVLQGNTSFQIRLERIVMHLSRNFHWKQAFFLRICGKPHELARVVG